MRFLSSWLYLSVSLSLLVHPASGSQCADIRVFYGSNSSLEQAFGEELARVVPYHASWLSVGFGPSLDLSGTNAPTILANSIEDSLRSCPGEGIILVGDIRGSKTSRGAATIFAPQENLNDVPGRPALVGAITFRAGNSAYPQFWPPLFINNVGSFCTATEVSGAQQWIRPEPETCIQSFDIATKLVVHWILD